LNLEHGNRRLISPTLLLAGLTLVAFALRFLRLGKWSLDSDEVFLLRDSLNPSLNNARPLLYYLNHYVVSPLIPLDEFGLRVLPAIFGVLGIPVFYLVARRAVGTRAALFGALLLTFSPLHLYYSQFARYWSLVFMLCAVYPYALYIGLRDRNARAIALGLVTGVVASLAHPSSILLLGGLGIWFLLTYVTRARLVHLSELKSVRWAALVVAVLAVVIAVRFIPILRSWLYTDKPLESGAFLLHLPGGRGVKEISFLMSFAESMTVPVFLAAVVGIYLLWQSRDRSLGLLLTCLFIFQLLFLTFVRLRAPISTFYLVPTLPVFFMAAGVFLDRLAGVEWKVRPAWLFPATVAIMMIVAGAPTLVSQYLDGRRWDLRGAARWLEGQLGPQDLIFSDQPRVLDHYLPTAKVQRLVADTARLEQALQNLQQSGNGGALWVVAPAPSHAFRTNKNLGELNRWLYDHCQLRNSVGAGRVDFRQQYLETFRCSPRALPKSAAEANAEFRAAAPPTELS
jgi:mannosyltransferase